MGKPSNILACSWIERLKLAVLRAERWTDSAALVYSCIWEDASEGFEPRYVATMVYSYRVGDELYTGNASWLDAKGLDSFHRNDSITIRFDPRYPARSYFPEKQSPFSRRALVVSFAAFSVLCSVISVIVFRMP